MGLRGRAATVIGAVGRSDRRRRDDRRAAPAVAASDPPFHPGLIISDDAFYNFQSMSADDIQAFLEDRTCLPKDGVAVPRRLSRPTAAASPTQGPGHCAAITRPT